MTLCIAYSCVVYSSAVVDMKRVKQLKVLVALRTNIFQQLNYGTQSIGGQEEKFRELVLDITWTEGDLTALLQARAEAACRHYGIDPPRQLEQMLPSTNRVYGKPVKYILDRTLLRPRDAISFLNRCVREATGREEISWANIRDAERAYSQDRLEALRDEWKQPYLGIDVVLSQFRNKNYRLTRGEYTNVLHDVALLIAEGDKFSGFTWLEPMCQRIWAAGSSQQSWYELYGSLTKLLYSIGFIGVTRGAQLDVIYSYSDLLLTENPTSCSEDAYFEIHPAFRKALSIIEPPKTVKGRRK